MPPCAIMYIGIKPSDRGTVNESEENRMASSTWDDICTSVDNWAKKIGRKAEQLTDTAAIRLRLSAKKADLEEQYTLLGRLTFEHEYTPEQAEQSEADERTTSDKIAQCVAAIHTLREEIDKLSAECEKDT